MKKRDLLRFAPPAREPAAIPVSDDDEIRAEALRALPGLSTLPIFLEQPCLSLADCAQVAQRTNLPMIMDEPVTGLDALIEIRGTVGAGGVSIKPSRLGGIGPARLLRDAACALGYTVTIDDSWGGALTSAALSHLAASTPSENIMAVTFFTELASPMIADAPKRLTGGRGRAGSKPGLGVEVDRQALGEPVFNCSA